MIGPLEITASNQGNVSIGYVSMAGMGTSAQGSESRLEPGFHDVMILEATGEMCSNSR
jgi:hypothetical protein